MTLSRERLEEIALNDFATHAESVEMARSLLAADAPEPGICPKCSNTGLTDSGGVQPWGEEILVSCDCSLPDPELTQLVHDLDIDGNHRLANIIQSMIDAQKVAAQPVAVPDEIEPTIEAIKNILPTANPDEYAACVGADMWNACRAAALNQTRVKQTSGEPVSKPYKLPENVRDALTKALQAMEFMGDTLNNLDAVCAEDVEFVTPAFDAIREVLAAAPQEPTK